MASPADSVKQLKVSNLGWTVLSVAAHRSSSGMGHGCLLVDYKPMTALVIAESDEIAVVVLREAILVSYGTGYCCQSQVLCLHKSQPTVPGRVAHGLQPGAKALAGGGIMVLNTWTNYPWVKENGIEVLMDWKNKRDCPETIPWNQIPIKTLASKFFQGWEKDSCGWKPINPSRCLSCFTADATMICPTDHRLTVCESCCPVEGRCPCCRQSLDTPHLRRYRPL